MKQNSLHKDNTPYLTVLWNKINNLQNLLTILSIEPDRILCNAVYSLRDSFTT